MKGKVTVIVDNISNELLNLTGEWGLCLLIEYGDKKLLLDAGGSNLFLNNLKGLGFDVSQIDYGILSHAHYDHGNGIPGFFENNNRAKFYLRDGAVDKCYHKKKYFKKYIGLPKNLLKKYPDRIELISGDYKLFDGAYLIPHKTSGLDANGIREKMYVKRNHRFYPDSFSHEQSLVLDTDNGLVIFNSCSHGGVENIINEVQATFPDKRISAYIGGLHLFNKSEEEILAVAQTFKDKKIDYIWTGHCTKNRAYNILKEQLGERVNQLNVGLQFNV